MTTKHNGDDIKAIFKVLSYIALCLLISMIDNPIVAILSGAFWLFVWIFNIYDKLRYRRKEDPNEIRFPTQNDVFEKMTSLTLGIMIIIGSFIWLVRMNEFTLIPLVGAIAGLLIFINGLLDLPKGQLIIDKSKIRLNDFNDQIEISDIQSIEIGDDHLTISSKQNRKIRQGNLEFSKAWKSKLEAFLSKRINIEEIEIICRESA